MGRHKSTGRRDFNNFADNQVRLQRFALAYKLGQLPEASGIAHGCEARVVDDAAGEDDQELRKDLGRRNLPKRPKPGRIVNIASGGRRRGNVG